MSEEHGDMRRRLNPITMAAASTVCIGLTAGSTGASRSEVPAEEGMSSERGVDVQVPDSKERVEEYWTPDRMRAAKPMPKPLVKRDPAPPAVDQDGDAIETE